MSIPDLHHPDARAWVEVDLDAVRENFRTIQRRAGRGVAAIVMVKADGYGLGAERVVGALEPLDPWGYGIATAEEGAALRRMGITRPVLVVGPLPAKSVDLAASAGLTASLSDLDGLERWAAATEHHGPLDFHVEIDTGMGRSGFDWRETPRWAEAVKERLGRGLSWRGVYTHFQGADVADETPTKAQWERFQDALVQLPVSREDLLVHASNSAAALRWPEYSADAVRPGIFLYGGHAAPGLGADAAPAPRRVASLRARLLLVRDVPPGTTVGYGATYAARGWERWGTLGVGYGDGLPRSLGGVGTALVHGRRVALRGRISMDLTVVDLTEVPEAVPGDVVTLIGEDGDEEITVDEVAARVGTISYEILTGLGTRLPRIEA